MRLAILGGFCALVFGVPNAGAQSSPNKARTSTRVTPPVRTPAKQVAAKRPTAKPAAKRRARAATTAVRERRGTALGRQKQPQQTLEQKLSDDISKIWSGRHLRRGTTAIYAVDVATGETLYAVHEDERLNPASNVKLISTAAALDTLGPDWRYVTQVLGATPSPDGVSRGDVYLLGNFDPTLSRQNLADLAQRIADAGIQRIEGDIYVGAHPWRESVGKPRVTITVKGTAAGQPPEVTVSPAADLVQLDVRATTIAPKPVKRKRRRARRARIVLDNHLIEDEEVGAYYQFDVTGEIEAGYKATYRRRIFSGPIFTAHVLRAELIARGVSVTGTVRRSALPDYVNAAARFLPVELARHESKPIRHLVARINKWSINGLADRVIMTAGAHRHGGDPSMEKAVLVMAEWLRNRASIDPDDVVIDTGSGLSYNTELTARQIVEVLRSAGGYHTPAPDPDNAAEQPAEPEPDDDAIEQVFRESLAIGGVDGTLRRRFRRSRARRRVIGKTGTLTQVIALSGIVSDRENHAIAFAIVSNGHDHRRRRTVRKRHEAIVEALHRYLRARQTR